MHSNTVPSSCCSEYQLKLYQKQKNFISVHIYICIHIYTYIYLSVYIFAQLTPPLFQSEGMWSLQSTWVEWNVLLLGSWPQRRDAHHEGECIMCLTILIKSIWSSISTSNWHYKCVLVSVVVECMGPANGISCSPCERAALRTAAGPGSVDASGWSLTWKWDPTEGSTQGKRIHTQITFAIDTQNNQIEIYCWQILSSRMTEAPQPSVAGPKKEEMLISTEQTFKAANEDKESSELPTDDTDEWVLWAWFDNTHIKTLLTTPWSYSKTTKTIPLTVI